MSRVLLLLALLAMPLSALAQNFQPGGGKITVQETDGSPLVTNVSTIQVTAGALTDNGNGNVTIATGGGSSTLTIGASTVTGGTAGSILTVGAGPLAQQVNITGLVLGNGASQPSAYAGTSCTNQVVRLLSAAGAGTCVTITSAYVDGSIGVTGTGLNQFAATSSAQLAGVLSDESGTSGGFVRATGASIAPATLNIPNSITLPATCAVGDAYMDTDATSGQRFYLCQATNTWALQGDGGGGGSGDVVGPASATDNAVVRFDATTGKLIQNSGVTIDDSDLLTAPGGIKSGSGSTPGVLTLLEGTVCAAGTNSGEHNVCVDSSDSLLKMRENGGSLVTIHSTAYAMPKRLWFPAAGCDNATAETIWDLPTANAPAAACVTGTNTQKGVLDFDATTDESAQITYLLPTTFTGAIDARIFWLAAATTGSVGWCVQLVSTADAETDDPAFPAQGAGNCVSDAAKGTTLQVNSASITSVTATGVAAGELLHIQISRDANGGAVTDDMTGDARLIGVELTIKELF